MPLDSAMQDVFENLPVLREGFVNSLSAPRFQTYKQAAHGDSLLAIDLYTWNACLAQSLWPSIQVWEICLRNKLNNFLCWRYSPSWPYDEQRALRQLKAPDRRKLEEARERQQIKFRLKRAPTPAIVADLSVGFWVSLLSGAYAIPFVWRSNLHRIFPQNKSLELSEARRLCDEILELRNRIAHHEPILNFQLERRHESLNQIVAAMCPGSATYCAALCTFKQVWLARPSRQISK
jgi:hypothetical protein